VKTPSAAIVQYALLFAGVGTGIWIILHGVVIEPPAALMEAVNKTNARLLRLFGRPVTA
jgi:lipopolysaccharide export system permease protein